MNAKLLGLIAGVGVLTAACSDVCDVEKGGGVVTPGSSEDFKANAPDTAYFDFDSSKVSDAAKKRIDAQACWLKTYTGTEVTVEGHTDIRGTAEYNLALGTARATSVKKVLEESGVKGDRITVVSYGKERVADEGTTEEAHAKNRRAVTVVGK
ncbi:MAG: OmpA family protein [Holosporales bacterium]|nr:OmpA family protein [Holosporales bacterium]